jgi:hypothetical protein
MILIPKYKDSLQLEGTVGIVVVDATGRIKEEKYFSNTIVDNGKAWIATRFAASPSGSMTHMGVGTGAIAVNAATDTALGAEVSGNSYARQSATTDVATSKTVKYSATFAANIPTVSVAITEAGIFTAVTAGIMLCRTVFAVVNKAAADSLTINWTITIS